MSYMEKIHCMTCNNYAEPLGTSTTCRTECLLLLYMICLLSFVHLQIMVSLPCWYNVSLCNAIWVLSITISLNFELQIYRILLQF